jgi:hypothetical protein
LGNAAGFGRAAKVALVGKGDEHFQLVDHAGRVAGIGDARKGGGLFGLR